MSPRKKMIIKIVSLIATCTIILSLLPTITAVTKSSSDSYANIVMLPNNNQGLTADPFVEDTGELGFAQEVQLFFASIFAPNGFKEIEKMAYKSIGVVQILKPDTNIRTEADPNNSSNIAWVANQWEKYVVVDTTSYGETVWYEIIKPGTVNESYYVSSVVSSVVAGNGTELSDTVESNVEDMVDSYFKDRKRAFKNADFSHIEKYFIPDSALFNAEKELVQNPPLKMNDYEIVNIYTSEEGNLYVRVFEENMDFDNFNEVEHVFYLHDFLVIQNENGEFLFTEKVASTYMVK